MKQAYADLELGLRRGDAGSHVVELRFRYSDSETEERSARDGVVRFDLDALRALAHDSAAYGALLGERLFADPAVRDDVGKALVAAQARDIPLRLRLFVNANAPELHALRWEALHGPLGDAPLFGGEHVSFSRYLSSADWRPVGLRARGDLRTLVMVASPSDLADYGLNPLDVGAEVTRASAALNGEDAPGAPESIPVATLASAGTATLGNLLEHLRAGCDILYLVCHGAMVADEPWLWLEDESGATARVAGRELVTRVQELQQRPCLVVLLSCHSAGSGARGEEVPAAMGPRLAEAGVPAVLAMQGAVSVDTAAGFMPLLFREVMRHGQIDRAVAVARGAVRDRPDWWMPVLFMRLQSGRLWYVPGFAGEQQGFEKWPALLRRIGEGRCTPILGTGLLEPLFGSPRAVAQRWAETYHFPMAAYDREDLPQVAQFLAVNQDYDFPRSELAAYLRQELLHRFGAMLPADVRNAPLDRLLREVGTYRRAHGPPDLHHILAGLPIPIYVSTNPDNLLADALAAAGKAPEVELCPWRDDLEALPSVYDREPGYHPDPSRPLVYHLFGHLRQRGSVVLTEDDYFDYLIGVTANRVLIPPAVRSALANTALLFLGFDLTGWDFRVLFRSIMGQEGGHSLRRRYAHVAAQIDPEQGRFLEPERARRYLESYFGDAEISIYWGSAEDFIRELHRRWIDTGRLEVAP